LLLGVLSFIFNCVLFYGKDGGAPKPSVGRILHLFFYFPLPPQWERVRVRAFTYFFTVML